MLRKLLVPMLITSTLLVSSCAKLVIPPPTPTDYFQNTPWEVREKRLNAFVQWDIRGSFSLDNGDGKLHIASFTWSQQGQTYNIFIHSALNLYNATIKGSAGKAWLYRGDRPPVKASSPEELMQQELGYQLPISNLQFWIRGLPAVAKYSATYDQWGHLQTLRQNGWTINFERYRPMVNPPFKNVDVPGLLDMQRGKLRVKIAITGWNDF